MAALRASGTGKRGTRLAYLCNLSVAPAHRRRGVARALLQTAEDTAAAWGCRSVVLHVDWQDAAACALYQRAGYRHVSLEAPWAPALSLRRVRLLLMAKRVASRASSQQAGAAAPAGLSAPPPAPA